MMYQRHVNQVSYAHKEAHILDSHFVLKEINALPLKLPKFLAMDLESTKMKMEQLLARLVQMVSGVLKLKL